MENEITDNPNLAKIIAAWQYLKPWQRFIIFVMAMWYSVEGDLLRFMKRRHERKA